MQSIQFQDLGLIEYKAAWDYQASLFDAIIAQKVINRNLPPEEHKLNLGYLLFCEHPHVYTLGKSGAMDNMLYTEEEMAAKGISFYKTNRGGDITYHGPGQVVGYPIMDLDLFFNDIHKYMRNLEEVIIRTIAHYGIKGGRLKGFTGVWLDEEDTDKARKICAMGVKCSRWVTMHGWALNVNADLAYFDGIVPCGIDDKAVTSVQKETGHIIDMEEVKNLLKVHFAEVFDCHIAG